MATDVVMPNLGFDTQSGRLIEWLKQPGDPVRKGEAIAVIESDKANVELEAIAGGVLLEQRVAPDEEVDVGSVIARIGAVDEYQQAQPAPAAAPAAPPTENSPRISPVAQRIAQDRQIPVEQIVGSGGRGRVTRRDVEAYAVSSSNGGNGADLHGVKALPVVRRAARERGIDLATAGLPNPVTLAALDAYIARTTEVPAVEPRPEPAAAPVPSTETPANATVIPITRMRQTIGRRLSESMREAPHFYVTGEFVLDAALERLKAMPAKINDLILYLTTQTLLRVPELNATYQDETLLQYTAVNLALAVARDDGLLSPVLRDAGRYSLAGLAAESRELIGRARTNRLTTNDMQGGTFTISNLGMVKQVDHFTAVINPPQVGILAVGALKPRPVVIDGGLFVRQTVHLTLSGDHRVVDGMHLARFMAAFQEELDRFSL